MSRTSWLVTGATGQLGTSLRNVLGQRSDADVVALDRAGCDLTDEDSVRRAVRDFVAALPAGQRAVVVNAGAYTAVDEAETDESTALAVNGHAPGWLAEEVAEVGRRVRLVHVSTDYVFSGRVPLDERGQPRGYEVDDETGPVSAYGRTKLAGERAVLAALPTAGVVRTAWVFASTGANFVRTMLRFEAERETLDVVADQTGNPTFAPDLASGLVALGERMHDDDQPSGVLHATGAGSATWCDLAQAVFRAAGADPGRVRPTTSDAYVRPAPRPTWSVLSPASWLDAGLTPLPAWQGSVERCLQQLRGGPAA